MSTEIAHRSVDSKIEWARAIAPSGLLPKAYQGKPANLFLAAEYADALGIERINALTSIHVIEGKPTMSADLMVALARRAGHRVRVQVRGDAAKATLIRADDPEFEYECVWTMQRAQAAGLTGKGVWKSYPQAMLRSRALSEVIRMGASEVLIGGIYTPEELGAETDGTGQPLTPQPITTEVTVAELMGDEPEPTTPAPDEPDDAEIAADNDTGWPPETMDDGA